MAGAKRKAPPSKGSKRKGKRQQPLNSTAIDLEPEEDLESIIARIQEQEESEALKDKDPVASTSASRNDVIDIDEEADECEGDEALAKRLAREWELEDQNRAHGHSKSPSVVELQQQSIHSVCSSGSGSQSGGSDLPPDEQLLNFRDLFTADRRCSKCGSAVKSPRGYVVLSVTGPPGNLISLLHAFCSVCRTNHCRGCFTPIPCPSACKGNSTKKVCPVQTCCAEARAVAIFEVLGGFDREYLGERATSESRAQAAVAKKKKSNASVGPGGTGYGIGDGGHTEAPARSSKSSRNDELAMHWEKLITRTLTTLTDLLPSPYAESAQVYDMVPHPSLGLLLSVSQLPELLGSLLRNDSVTDWIARSETYHAMIGLLQRMVDCELTIHALITRGWEKRKSCGIEAWMWGDGEIGWSKGKETIERTPPLYEHFKKLTKQCEAFIAGASQMMDTGGERSGEQDAGDVEETVVKATSLCGDIIAARDDMERAMAVLGKATSSGEAGLRPDSSNEDQVKGKGRVHVPAIDMEKQYTLDCERLAFRHIALSEAKGAGGGLVYSNYAHTTHLTQTASATRHPKDRLHLIKELAVMATCLPVGIWVRVDEIRNDAIKIMMAGPDDTPYAGGLFEFDCFLPIGYPKSPPLMQLRTTGGGSVGFNPNLYNNGKVCLSLLGTWEGRPEEQWSSKSTLLQVLVSIQSMILIDAPYFNEPGYGPANLASAESKAYNRNISMQTVRWAIVEWLREEHRNGVWGEVISSHFNIRGSNIRKCIQEWAVSEPGIRAYRSQGKAAVDLLEEYDQGIERLTKGVIAIEHEDL